MKIPARFFVLAPPEETGEDPEIFNSRHAPIDNFIPTDNETIEAIYPRVGQKQRPYINVFELNGFIRVERLSQEGMPITYIEAE
jgi:hypothetical protein